MVLLEPKLKTIAKTGRDSLYQATAEPALVEVPATTFAMVEGHGDPNTAPAYKDAITALYGLSYALKFALKREAGLDYRVGLLEGLFWADDMADFGDRKVDWSWTMMIAQPHEVTPQRFATMLEEVKRKKGLVALDRIRLEGFDEGLCAQILHIGPFTAEGPSIEKLHAFIRSQGYSFDGRKQKHHEIYMSDPRRVVPARWKTVIRQAVASR